MKIGWFPVVTDSIERQRDKKSKRGRDKERRRLRVKESKSQRDKESKRGRDGGRILAWRAVL